MTAFSMVRRLVPFAIVLLAAACQTDLSFKSTVIEKVTRDQAYDAALAVIANHFYQVTIFQDREQGQIQTDYIFKGVDPLFRQKVWVGINAEGQDAVRVEVLAPIEQADTGANALQWRLLGSDTKVEQFLLERIVEKVLTAPGDTDDQGPPVVDG
jgi:hypothetical protein